MGAHKTGVSKLLAIGGKEAGGPERLVSGGADGSLAVWEPKLAAPGGAPREIPPTATTKAHDSEIVAMTLSHRGSDGFDSGPTILVTAGIHPPNWGQLC